MFINQNNVYEIEDTAEKLTGGIFRKNKKCNNFEAEYINNSFKEVYILVKGEPL